jgi:hypothetical protein
MEWLIPATNPSDMVSPIHSTRKMLSEASEPAIMLKSSTITQDLNSSYIDIARQQQQQQQQSWVWRLPPINETHKPSFFKHLPYDDFQRYGNILHVLSGCLMTAFVYVSAFSKYGRLLDDCSYDAVIKERRLNKFTLRLLQPYDTVYIPFLKLGHFVQMMLSSIDVPIVLILGQWQWEKFSNETFDAIINNSFIIRWFMHDLGSYAKDPDHPKLNSWPYGIKQTFVRDLRFEMLKPPIIPKTNKIFSSFLRLRPENPTRDIVHREDKLNFSSYLIQMHHSEYVLAPNGDRPECHRHWEALALGTIPITELRPQYHRHFIGTGLIFQQTN